MDPQRLLTRALLLIAMAAAAPTLSAQALDLTPRVGTYIGESTPFPCIRFLHGTTQVRFMPPERWRFAARDGHCAFEPVGTAQASGTFKVQPRAEKPAAEDGERMEALLRAQLPREATDVTLHRRDLPQVMLDRWASTHAQVVYTLFGQRFRCAVVVVPLEREELHITFGSREVDFGRLFPAFFESLATFTWEEPEAAKATAAVRAE